MKYVTKVLGEIPLIDVTTGKQVKDFDEDNGKPKGLATTTNDKLILGLLADAEIFGKAPLWESIDTQKRIVSAVAVASTHYAFEADDHARLMAVVGKGKIDPRILLSLEECLMNLRNASDLPLS